MDCYICEEPIDYKANRVNGRPGWQNGLQLEHVIPISAGGANTIENVKPSHGFCNISKVYDRLEDMGCLESRKKQYYSALKSADIEIVTNKVVKTRTTRTRPTKIRLQNK